MKLTAFNRNIYGVQFGGSLYAMCDPWFALILIRSLGQDYIVWDKAASIQFLQPGRNTVTATFHIPQEHIAEIRLEADRGQKIEPTFAVDVLDAQDQIIAHVEKLLYVRKKKIESQFQELSPYTSRLAYFRLTSQTPVKIKRRPTEWQDTGAPPG